MRGHKRIRCLATMFAVRVFLVALLIHVVTSEGDHAVTNDRNPYKKFLSLFTLVRFPNDPCTATISGTSYNGTCYSSADCTNLGGINGGQCATGFGVCCVVKKGCDAETTTNATYWEASLKGVGSCKFTIKNIPEDVCQIKLELETFTLAKPTAGACSDIFTATKMDIGGDDVLCGENAGQHVILHTGRESGNVELAVQTQSTTSSAEWKIKVIFTKCDSPLLAPRGCTQYFVGSSGQIQSFGYDGTTVHLRNQNYGICFRSEQDRSNLQLSVCNDNSYRLTGADAKAKVSGSCVTVGTVKDVLVIPCGRKEGAVDDCAVSAFCGGSLNDVDDQETDIPIISTLQSVLRFVTDAAETGDTDNIGFCLNYVQKN